MRYIIPNDYKLLLGWHKMLQEYIQTGVLSEDLAETIEGKLQDIFIDATEKECKTKLTCCGTKIVFDDTNEGNMPEPDGRKQLQGICKHCGKLYYLQVIDSQDGFE